MAEKEFVESLKTIQKYYDIRKDVDREACKWAKKNFSFLLTTKKDQVRIDWDLFSEQGILQFEFYQEFDSDDDWVYERARVPVEVVGNDISKENAESFLLSDKI